MGEKAQVRGGQAIRATLFFAAACLLAFVVVLSVLLMQSYQESIARAQTRALAYSQVVSANAALLMESTFQALRRIDVAVGDKLEEPSDETLGDLNEAVESLPSDVRAWLIDAEGVPRLSNTQLSSAFNVADRDYFVGVKAGDAFRVSPLMISRTAGDPIFAVAKRIERGGRFLGAAVIIIPATYLDRLRAPLSLGPNSTLGLIRNDGMLVTRSPVPPEATDMSKYILFTDYLKASDQGTYFATSPTDGVHRIVGYGRVPQLPLVAVASIALDEALAPFQQTALILALFGIPGLIGLGTFALWTIRSQRALSAALAQNQSLLGEIHHRVKNNLQQAMALINMQALPAEARAEISRRLMVMAAVHEQMYRADEYAVVNAAQFLPSLIDGVRQGFASPITVSTSIAPALMDRDRALPVALIVSEVMANAAKHAFKDGRAGEIAVRLEQTGPYEVRLIVEDNGVGFDGAGSKGTGTKLIAAFARQLETSYAYETANGTRFTLPFGVRGFANT